MSEFDKLLDTMARRACLATTGKAVVGDFEAVRFVLRETVLPLLEAGQAMRIKLGPTVRCIGFPDCDGDLPGEPHSKKCISRRTPSVTQLWDKQKQAAMEGR